MLVTQRRFTAPTSDQTLVLGSALYPLPRSADTDHDTLSPQGFPSGASMPGSAPKPVWYASAGGGLSSPYPLKHEGAELTVVPGAPATDVAVGVTHVESLVHKSRSSGGRGT